MSNIDAAVSAARSAFDTWADTPFARRAELILAVAEGYRRRKNDLTEIICRQTGKPPWEAAGEVDSMIAKAAISISAQEQRRPVATRQIGNITAATRYIPIGVFAVLGPFNMPGHLPNGHLMPAVLAGNTVIFKPSELTPLVGQLMAEIWTSAGFSAGVFNLIQGAAETGTALVRHQSIDGVLFTGSVPVGTAIHRSLAGHPEKMLALEMGGNNPLIVWDCANLDAAVHLIVQSAFISSGQRCSCARRLIIPTGPAGEEVLQKLIQFIPRVRVGLYTDSPEPFMGTVISPQAAQKLLQAQTDLKNRGALSLIEMRSDPRFTSLLHPGLIDVTGIDLPDTEIFGPLLQVIRATDFDAAVLQARHTRFGLAAGLVSDRPDFYETFRRRIRAGVVNFNRPLTGARGDLPFGGIGLSGNHRPSAQFAADYCSDPVASLEADRVTLPEVPTPGIT